MKKKELKQEIKRLRERIIQMETSKIREEIIAMQCGEANKMLMDEFLEAIYSGKATLMSMEYGARRYPRGVNTPDYIAERMPKPDFAVTMLMRPTA